MDTPSPTTKRHNSAQFSATMDDLDTFGGVLTPTKDDTTLAPGGPLAFCSLEGLGLIIQYSAMGLLDSGIADIARPLYSIYLNVDPTNVQMYTVVVTFGYYFKVFFGIVSDCVPIFGYRRKSYMLIGWTITLMCMVAMACIPFGRPYCENPELCHIPLETLDPSDVAESFDLSAPSRGLPFLVLSMVLSFGYIMTVCASDALVVQYAHREPIETRGRTLCAVYAIRNFSSAVAFSVTRFFLNGPSYQGSFSFEIQPNVVFVLLSLPSGLAITNTLLYIREYREKGMPVRVYLHGLWELAQKRVLWQICMYTSIAGLFGSFRSTAESPVTYVWAKVTHLSESLTTVVGSLVWGATLVCIGRWGVNWNWRVTIVVTTLVWVTLDSVGVFTVVWDGYRNEWFFSAMYLVSSVPSAVRFIMSFFCAVEIADMGNEGAVYGLITTIFNVTMPLGPLWYKWLDSYFDVTTKAVDTDSNDVRWQVTYTYLISYGMHLFALVFLVLLPPQKIAMQELKRYGGSHPVFAVAVLGILFVCLVVAITSNLLSIFPSTRCLAFAGGDGCP